MTVFKQVLGKVLGAALLGLVALSPAMADVTVLNALGPDRDFPRVTREYTQMDAEFVRRGTQRTVAQVRQIEIGSTKRQLVGAIGQPVSAYADGSWNFDVQFRLPQGNQLVCQYRVYFDEAEQVAGTVWRRPQCADIAINRVN